MDEERHQEGIAAHRGTPLERLGTRFAGKLGSEGEAIGIQRRQRPCFDDQGEVGRDGLLEVLDVWGALFRFEGRDDNPPLLHPDRALVTQQAIHLREEFDQLTSPLLQPYGTVFGHMQLLADLRPERRPRGGRNQGGFWIGLAPALGHPDIPGPEGAPQFP